MVLLLKRGCIGGKMNNEREMTRYTYVVQIQIATYNTINYLQEIFLIYYLRGDVEGE